MPTTASATNDRIELPKEVKEVLQSLVQAGVELGVAEAIRRFAVAVPLPAKLKKVEAQAFLGAAIAAEVVQAIRNDSNSIFHLVKEVFSRGGSKDRRTAARALGRGIGRIEPHKSLGITRDLAAMARNADEADMVGAEAIGPILEGNPTLYDRTKQFLTDNERWVRRAAIAGLVAYVTAKRKVAGLVLEVILLLAENNEKEIRAAVKWAVKEISKVDWKATAAALAAWAGSDPARLKIAKEFIGATATNVQFKIQKAVFGTLAKIGESGPTAPVVRPKPKAAKSR